MPIISNRLDTFFERHFIFRENSILLQDGRLPDEDVMRRCLAMDAASDWFGEPEQGYTAIELERDSPNPAGLEDIPLREFFARTQEDGGDQGALGAMAARAKGLLHFKASRRFCSRCGGKLRDDRQFTARTCSECGEMYFPQIEPAIIVLVTRGEELLLARHVRHAARSADFWTTLAGFVEIGETAERAVHREIFEETGIRVKDVRYVTSQAWPYPDQLMLAFRAEYESGEIRVQEEEILEAGWFTRDSLPPIPPAGSVAHNLITGVFG